eukprot:355684-Hanusia_phi.AAC.1
MSHESRLRGAGGTHGSHRRAVPGDLPGGARVPRRRGGPAAGPGVTLRLRAAPPDSGPAESPRAGRRGAGARRCHD